MKLNRFLHSVVFLSLIILCSCGLNQDRLPAGTDSAGDTLTPATNFSESSSGEVHYYLCESEQYVSIRRRPTSQADDRTATVYDYPVTRNDTSYNEDVIYLFDSLSWLINRTSPPDDSITETGVVFECAGMAVVGDESSGYCERYIRLKPKGVLYPKTYWAQLSTYMVQQEDVPEHAQFTVYNYYLNFTPLTH